MIVKRIAIAFTFSDGGVTELAATFGGRVHPRTRAGGGARLIQVLRSRTQETMGGAGVSKGSGVLAETGADHSGVMQT